MARVLSIHRLTVTPSERKKYYDRLKRKRAHYEGAGCRFWVFEEAGLPGAFLEFFEADDAATLTRAHADAPETVLDPNRIYQEVELK
jgi:hypothetical protein